MRDNGTGFADPGLDRTGGHFGLRGIRERVDKLGGTLTLANHPSGGAVVAVCVPLRNRQARVQSRRELLGSEP